MELKYIRVQGKTINKGDIIPMYIKKVDSNGVHGVYGTLETFIPIQQLRYGFVKNIYSEYEVGKQMFVKVMRISKQDEITTISVSGKYAQIDPWGNIGVTNQIKTGDVLTGEVTSIKEYGLFINLFDGVDALVRPMSKKAHNYQPVHEGDKVDVKITDIDFNKREVKGRLRWVEKRIRIHY